jgi:hypothetical protein
MARIGQTRPIEFGRHGDPPFGAGAGPGCLRRQLREQMLPGVRSFGFTVQFRDYDSGFRANVYEVEFWAQV